MLAGAGSGKTGVIARKIAYLTEQRGVSPEHIAAITFTNKAAQEMRARIKSLLPRKSGQRPWISTFHTLGLHILRRESRHLGYRPGFTIFDAADCAGLIANLTRRETASGDIDTGMIQRRISAWKYALVGPGAAAASADPDPSTKLACACYGKYRDTLKVYNAVDFDDLIMLPVLLFRENPEILAYWQMQIRHLLVDEYQDTNLTQYELVRLLAGDNGQLTVVGDDDQSIYAWRGAQPENMVRLADDFADLKIIKLEQNYRSVGVILKAANQLIANNTHVFDKQLWSERGFGEKIRLFAAADEHAEAEYVVNSIMHRQLLKGAACRDFAVLFRSNYQARVFEHAFRERGIPYILSGGRSFFDYTEIKDVVCYLRLLANPTDDNALLRVVNTPRRGIGAATVEQLVKAAATTGTSLFDTAMSQEFRGTASPRALRRVEEFCTWLNALLEKFRAETVAAIMKRLLQDIDYEAWIAQTSATPEEAERRNGNVQELLLWMERIQHNDPDASTLSDVVNALTLFDIVERKETENEQDCVSLTTLHAAKGLEFPHVYLVGVEENVLPHRRSIDEGSVDEERRLAYVGITRAQETLAISFASTRQRYGQVASCAPSRFIDELPQEDLAWEGRTIDEDANRKTGRATLSNLKQMLRVP